MFDILQSSIKSETSHSLNCQKRDFHCTVCREHGLSSLFLAHLLLHSLKLFSTLPKFKDGGGEWEEKSMELSSQFTSALSSVQFLTL